MGGIPAGENQYVEERENAREKIKKLELEIKYMENDCITDKSEAAFSNYRNMLNEINDLKGGYNL